MPRPTAPSAFVLAASLIAALPITAHAQPAYMVADLGSYIPSLPWFEPLQLEVIELDNIGYFFHDDGVHGSELWRTDGTALGTFMVRDLCPGLCGARVLAQGPRLAVLGSHVFFSGNDGVRGGEVWRTDGTALGMALVRDLQPGVASSAPGQFLTAAGQVFFTGDDGVHGRELWRTDGTAKGTTLVKDFTPGPLGGWIFRMAEGEGGLFLAVGGSSPEPGLWISNGEMIGTLRLAEVNFYGANPFKGGSFVVLESGVLVFAGATQESGYELWRSDGTVAGTLLLEDLVPGEDGSYVGSFVRFRDEVIFEAITGAGLPSKRLWKTSGNPGGTFEIAIPPTLLPRLDLGMHAVQGTAFVVFAGEELSTGLEPWIYDGTAVTSLGDLRPGALSSIDAISAGRLDHAIFAKTGERVTFLADDGTNGLEFWSTDGSPTGTTRISELFENDAAPSFDSYAQFVPSPILGSSALFRRWESQTGFHLLRSDGTTQGTGAVDSLGGASSSFLPRRDSATPFSALGPFCTEPAASNLGFQVFDGETGRFQMWGSDGTTSGTELLLSIAGDSVSLSFLGCTTHQGRVLFLGDDGSGTSLWSTGGTPALTTPLLNLQDGSTGDGGLRPYFIHSLENTFFGTSGTLWMTDGTSEGSLALASLAQFSWGELALQPPSKLFFSDFELYVIEATPGNEIVTIDLNADQPSYPFSLTVLDSGAVLFASSDDQLGSELWRTDGTPDGTSLVRDIRPGLVSSIWNLQNGFSDEGFPSQIISLGPTAVLTADDGAAGAELWISDGTSLGTGLLRDIYPGDYPSTPRNFTRLGNRVFFSAESELEGLELWATDGTYDGTVLVKDIATGGISSIPDDLVVRDGVLYFSAWTPNYGREAWKSDGTFSGTIRITDIAPGPKSSSPQRFARAGKRLYFSATDQIHGYELWAISDDGSIPLFLDGFESANTSRWSDVEP